MSASFRIGRGLGRLTAYAMMLWLVWCVCKALGANFGNATIAFLLTDAFSRGWNNHD